MSDYDPVRDALAAQPAQAIQVVCDALAALCAEFVALLRHHLGALTGADGAARAAAEKKHLSERLGTELYFIRSLGDTWDRLSEAQRDELVRGAPSMDKISDNNFESKHAMIWIMAAVRMAAGRSVADRSVYKTQRAAARPDMPVDVGETLRRDYLESLDAGRDVNALLIDVRARTIASAPEYIEWLIALCDAEAVKVARGSDLNALASDIARAGNYLYWVCPDLVIRTLWAGHEALNRRAVSIL